MLSDLKIYNFVPSVSKTAAIFTTLGLGFAALFYNELRELLIYPGVIHGQLPTFLHVFLFSFLTVIFGGLSRSSRWIVSTFWVVLNTLVELSQWFGIEPFYGTFDWLDLLSGLIGGVSVYLILGFFTCQRIRWAGKISIILFGASILTATSQNKHERLPGGLTRQTVCPPFGQTQKIPVYLSYEELRQPIDVKARLTIQKVGKDVTIESRRFVSDLNLGIHIIDVSNPKNPTPLFFLKLPGNNDFELKDGIVYADSFVDLVVIDTLVDPPELIRRENYFFPWDPYQAFPGHDFTFQQPELNESLGVVVDTMDVGETSKREARK